MGGGGGGDKWWDMWGVGQVGQVVGTSGEGTGKGTGG